MLTSGDTNCACATYAQPDTSNSNICTCQSGYTKAGTNWDTDNVITGYECILCSIINSGVGADSAGCTSNASTGCATNAYPGSS